MGNQVYANMMEVSCKAAAGKSICAFPDVCFTPPETPVTPPGVPIPYPNTGMASDTTDGSSSVKISGQEVMLKNKSYFKRSMGDEAGCAAKKGVLTSTNMGKVYFNAWSMDVKVEGENVVRMLDITTHNHASVPGNSPTWPYIDEASVPADLKEKCGEVIKKEKAACAGCTPNGSKDPCGKDKEAKECQQARTCMLLPYRKYDKASKKMVSPCCPGQTGHHLIPQSFANSFSKGGRSYSKTQAPCICVTGKTQRTGTHGQVHALQEASIRKLQKNGKIGYKECKRAAARSAKWVFAEAGCSSDCVEAQLDAYHNQVGISDDTKLPVKKILGSDEAKPSDILDLGRSIKARLRG
jgi:hypothetical protein